MSKTLTTYKNSRLSKWSSNCALRVFSWLPLRLLKAKCGMWREWVIFTTYWPSVRFVLVKYRTGVFSMDRASAASRDTCRKRYFTSTHVTLGQQVVIVTYFSVTYILSAIDTNPQTFARLILRSIGQITRI